jgi:hypothetical protein
MSETPETEPVTNTEHTDPRVAMMYWHERAMAAESYFERLTFERDELREATARAKKEIDVLRHELAVSRAKCQAAIDKLCRISSFVHPGGFIVNSKGYSFHPPDALVREAWEALSNEIRGIDSEAILAGGRAT